MVCYVSFNFLCIYYYVVLFYLQILSENTEVESIPAAAAVVVLEEEEEIEEVMVKSHSMLLQERQDLAEEFGKNHHLAGQ